MQWKAVSQRIEKQPNEWSTYNFHTAAFPHILPSHLWLFIWSHLIYSNAAASHTLCARSTTTNMGGSFKTFMWRAKTEKRKRGLEGRGGRSSPEIYYYWAGIILSKKRETLESEQQEKSCLLRRLKTFAVIVQAHLPHLLHSQFPRELFRCLMRANFNC